MSDYHLVELRGGPAHGELVQVHRDQSRVRVMAIPPKLDLSPPHDGPPRFRALTPIHIYYRDVNHGAFADYDGDEQ